MIGQPPRRCNGHDDGRRRYGRGVIEWLDAHGAAVAAGAGVAAALAVAALPLLVVRALRQGQRALLGARPVLRPPRVVPAAGAGLALEVLLENTGAWHAEDVRVEARVEGRRLTEATAPGSLFGVSADGTSTGGHRWAFPWPVGVLDGSVEIRWSWRDGAGRHRARWRGEMRVPQPDLPGARAGASAAAAVTWPG